jgi:hypothetical protein
MGHRQVVQEAAAVLGEIVAIGANTELNVADLRKANRFAHALLDRRSALESACGWLGIAIPVSLTCEKDRNRVWATSAFVVAVEELALPKSVKDRLLSKHAIGQREVLVQFGLLIREANKTLTAKLDAAEKLWVGSLRVLGARFRSMILTKQIGFLFGDRRCDWRNWA